jgi:hypothetical protein
MTNIDIFKQEAVRWIGDRTEQLFGNGIAGKMLRPIIDEFVKKYSHDPRVDAFLSIFVDEDGKFNIDTLLNKYIDALEESGGLRFKWADIAPVGAMIDSLNGNKVNVITAGDIRALRDAFIAATKE